eukprot:1139252-Pelagomonas_calceolata.AAC.1
MAASPKCKSHALACIHFATRSGSRSEDGHIAEEPGEQAVGHIWTDLRMAANQAQKQTPPVAKRRLQHTGSWRGQMQGCCFAKQNARMPRMPPFPEHHARMPLP